MNNIRLYTRDLSVKDRSTSMTALDRIHSDECLENFNRLRPLLLVANPGLVVIIVAFLLLAKYFIINVPRRFVSINIIYIILTTIEILDGVLCDKIDASIHMIIITSANCLVLKKEMQFEL